MGIELTRESVLGWLRETDAGRLEELWREADRTRRESVGEEVHLRGLVELSNHCMRQCGYCGVRAGNRGIERYRMTEDEVLSCARRGVKLGFGTLVLQAGEDPGLTRELIERIVRRVKAETPLAVTLSLGERTEEELAAWREAGADRYLLRFETSDRALFDAIHPPLPGRRSDRIAMLRRLRGLGYEIGSGVMVGIPGQSLASLADDVLLFRELDLDMIGVGPFLPHPATPLGSGEWSPPAVADQAPNSEDLVLKMVSLARLACPQANIPSTTALATLNKTSGRERGLVRGANVVMPNLTPPGYREKYEIYPGKACINETAEQCQVCLEGRILRVGRTVGRGQGGRRRCPSGT